MWGGGEPTMQTESPSQQVFGDFASGMSGSSQGIATAMGESDDADIDPDITELLKFSSETAPSGSGDVSNLLSEFEGEDDAVDKDEIEFSHDSPTEEAASNWTPGDSETEVFRPEQEEPEQDRTVRQNCSSCDKRFEVELPSGVDAARTACPHCGSIESVSLG